METINIKCPLCEELKDVKEFYRGVRKEGSNNTKYNTNYYCKKCMNEKYFTKKYLCEVCNKEYCYLNRTNHVNTKKHFKNLCLANKEV